MGLALDELKKNEKTIPVNTIDLLIADNVKPYTEGNTIDYIRSADGEGFTIVNPGKKGCGDCSC